MSNIILLVIALSVWFISSVVKKANKAAREQEELERMKRMEQMNRQSGQIEKTNRHYSPQTVSYDDQAYSYENGHSYDNAYSYEENPFTYDNAAIKGESAFVTKAKPDRIIASNEPPQQSQNAAIKIAEREFDLDTAVIFSEILRPKYQDY